MLSYSKHIISLAYLLGLLTTHHTGISASVTPAVRALRTHLPAPAVLAEHRQEVRLQLASNVFFIEAP